MMVILISSGGLSIYSVACTEISFSAFYTIGKDQDFNKIIIFFYYIFPFHFYHPLFSQIKQECWIRCEFKMYKKILQRKCTINADLLVNTISKHTPITISKHTPITISKHTRSFFPRCRAPKKGRGCKAAREERILMYSCSLCSRLNNEIITESTVL
jgi:hypothetical protein